MYHPSTMHHSIFMVHLYFRVLLTLILISHHIEHPIIKHTITHLRMYILLAATARCLVFILTINP